MGNIYEKLIYWQKHQTLFVIHKKISRKLYYKDVNTDQNHCARAY